MGDVCLNAGIPSFVRVNHGSTIPCIGCSLRYGSVAIMNEG